MKKSYSKNPFVSEGEENESSQETGPESPPSSTFNEVKPISSPSAKRSRRSIQKRVVSVPMKDVEVSRLKGDTAPPSDSWAWRKYGQKPIKGSPYPRGYYRCSSSKGCPARKQVERSRDDPTMILITYTCDHNHPWPASRNPHHKHHPKPEPEPEPEPVPEPDLDHHEDKFMDLGYIETTSSLILNGGSTGAATACHVDEFAWFGEMETTSSTILDSPIFSEKMTTVAEKSPADADVAMFFPMREEDESLFADLGELPECSVVFRHRSLGSRVEIC